MSTPSPPWSGWPPSYPHPVNGSSLELGVILGQILDRSNRQISLGERQLEVLSRIETRLAQPLPTASPAPPPAASTPSIDMPMLERLIKFAIIVLAPLAAGLLAGREAAVAVLKQLVPGL